MGRGERKRETARVKGEREKGKREGKEGEEREMGFSISRK